MGFCVLSVEETARLERYRIFPACRGHQHVSKLRAQQMLQEETHRLVGGNDTAVGDDVCTALVEVPVRAWEPVAAKPGEDCASGGLRTWGNAPSK